MMKRLPRVPTAWRVPRLIPWYGCQRSSRRKPVFTCSEKLHYLLKLNTMFTLFCSLHCPVQGSAPGIIAGENVGSMRQEQGDDGWLAFERGPVQGCETGFTSDVCLRPPGEQEFNDISIAFDDGEAQRRLPAVE